MLLDNLFAALGSLSAYLLVKSISLARLIYNLVRQLRHAQPVTVLLLWGNNVLEVFSIDVALHDFHQI